MEHGEPTALTRPVPPAPCVKHHAGIHSSDEEFLAVVVPFLRDGILAEEEPDPVVITTPRKLDLLRDALGPDARQVDFRDSARWYRGSPANSMATAPSTTTSRTRAPRASST